MASTIAEQHRTISIQIPEDAAPGDTLTFTVDGAELELTVPEACLPGHVLEIQVGGKKDTDFEDESVTRVALNNDTTLVLHHCCDPRNDVDGTHAMAWPAGEELARQLVSSSNNVLTQFASCRSVLELGSGLGLVGLALAAAAAA